MNDDEEVVCGVHDRRDPARTCSCSLIVRKLRAGLVPCDHCHRQASAHQCSTCQGRFY